MENQVLSWNIKKQRDRTLVVFSGPMDESSDFQSLRSLRENITFDLAGVTRLNSVGVHLWIEFVRYLSSVCQLVFVRCSIPIVNQINMIEGFKGTAKVQSFYAPYYCARTGEEEQRLLTVDSIPDPLNPPTFPCDNGVMELDELPERYFAFLLAEM